MSQVPVIEKIPLSKIMENPEQPRHWFRPGSIEEIAESMKAIGQQTTAKVRHLTEKEKTYKAGYLTKEEDEEGSEPPKETNDSLGYEYVMIGGHRRLAGAKLAGFETLDCFILDIPPEETHLASLMDNNLDEMDWWDWDLAIEKEHLAFPDMNQRDLAKRLGVSKTKVGRALRLLKGLDDYSRSLISQNLDPNNKRSGNFAPPRGKTSDEGDESDIPQPDPKPGYLITESVLEALAVLEDPDEIEHNLEILMCQRIPEAEVKNKLIEHIKDGGDANSYIREKWESKQKGEDPYAENWKGLHPSIKVKHKGGEDYEIRLAVRGGQKALELAQGAHRSLEGGLGAKILKFLNEAGNS